MQMLLTYVVSLDTTLRKVFGIVIAMTFYAEHSGDAGHANIPEHVKLFILRFALQATFHQNLGRKFPK